VDLSKFTYIYSLRPIILFIIIDVSRHILVIDTSVLARSNTGILVLYIQIHANLESTEGEGVIYISLPQKLCT
jgi:hypothetical protein